MIPQLFLIRRPSIRARRLPNPIKLRVGNIYIPAVGASSDSINASIYIHQFQVFCPESSSPFFTQSQQQWGKKPSKPSFTPSIEQRKVVRLCRTQNVIVSARPGSGKTATAEAIIAAHPGKRVAVLTYSKRLQLETRHRLRPYTNCEVFTFHGMAGSLFEAVVRDDAALFEQRRRVRRCNALPQWKYTPFDIIVLDEFQDCSEILYWLTNCFILANKRETDSQSPQLVILGDERQSIYQFRGADHRYLTLAPQILGHTSPSPFVKVSLSQSFRLSNHSVQFVNRVFLNDESYITSSKPGPKPIVLRCHPFDSHRLAKRLSALIESHGPKNTALIALSLRKNKQLQQLTNILSEKYHIPIAVSIDDEVALDKKVIYGKTCVSTVHQFKGSERHLVILFGIDSSFFEYFGRDIPNDRCPNEIFVALTRAAKQLVVVHDESKKLMPFVSVKALYETAEVINMTNNMAKLSLPNTQDEPLHSIITSNLRIQKLSPPLPKQKHIDIPNVVLSDLRKRFYEAVSDINGLVTVAAFEHSTVGTLNTLQVDQNLIEALPPIGSPQYVSLLCRYACEYEANISGYRSRKNQMKRHTFDWIKPGDL
ncbi:P-loop containing nucleoside triphosphate hydrolase protein, partial [Trichoderma velutinum]